MARKTFKSSDSPGFQAFWEGVGSSLRQEWKEAQEKFCEAIAQPTALPEAYYGRGVTRYHLGDCAGAAKDLEKAARSYQGMPWRSFG